MQFTKCGSLYLPDRQRQWIIPPSPEKNPERYRRYKERWQPKLATITHVKHATAANNTVQLTTVSAGNLIILVAQGFNAAVTSMTDGSSTWVIKGPNSNDGDLYMAYTLSSVATGTVTYTKTAQDFEHIQAWEFSINTGTWVFDTSNEAATGNSGTATSNQISTTGNPELVFGYSGCGGSDSFTTPVTIGGTAADGSILTEQDCASWYSILTSSMTNGAAAVAIGSSRAWECSIAAFKGAGGAAFVPRNQSVNQAINRSATY